MPKLSSLIDTIIINLNSTKIKAGNQTYKYEGGLLSGFPLTSILGSLVNLVELNIA